MTTILGTRWVREYAQLRHILRQPKIGFWMNRSYPQVAYGNRPYLQRDNEAYGCRCAGPMLDILKILRADREGFIAHIREVVKINKPFPLDGLLRAYRLCYPAE